MRLAALSAVLIASVAGAQAPTHPSEQRIYAAYTRLRAQPTLRAPLVGSESVGGRSVGYAADLSWRLDAPSGFPRLQTNLLEYRSDLPTRRVVGDGLTLWSYDLNRKEYSAAPYGAYRGDPGEGYVPALLSLLFASTRGQSAYLARLVREVYAPGGGPLYRSWAPGYTPFEPVDSMKDPITGQIYTPTAEQNYVMYGTDDPQTAKSVVFELTLAPDSTPQAPAYDLTRVFFAERGGKGALARTNAWSMRVFSGGPAYDSEFAPFAADQVRGWRPVVGPRPVQTR